MSIADVLCLRAQALVLRPREDCQLRSDVSSRTTALRNETHDKAQFREYEDQEDIENLCQPNSMA
uniref:Uncharacterized protein n=1 Tax=Heterorhabditis bacteriophora TaxID=37862 RepID=A0A1I7WSF6_HETBA